MRVISGTVFDVAVDLREGSQQGSVGRCCPVLWLAGVLCSLPLPGFLILSETAEFCYKCDDIYHLGDEGGIMWR